MIFVFLIIHPANIIAPMHIVNVLMLRIMPVLKLVSSVRLSVSLPCSVYYSRLFLVRPEIVHLKVLQKYMHGNGIWQVVTHSLCILYVYDV